MSRTPAGIRISLKRRGGPTYRVELIRIPFTRRFRIRRDGTRSRKLLEATATEIAEQIRRWLVGSGYACPIVHLFVGQIPFPRRIQRARAQRAMRRHADWRSIVERKGIGPHLTTRLSQLPQIQRVDCRAINDKRSGFAAKFNRLLHSEHR